MANNPCGNGYRLNRKGDCVPNRSGEFGTAMSMLGFIGSFIGAKKAQEKEEDRVREMQKAGFKPGEPIKSENPKKEKDGGTVFSRKSRKTNYNGKKKSKSKK